MKKIKKIAHRGHLKNLIKKGLIEVKCLFHYTDDYAFDAAMNNRTDKEWIPAEWVENLADGRNGYHTFRDWDFKSSSGYLSKDKGEGIYSFAIHSNLVYSVRLKPTVDAALPAGASVDFASLLSAGAIEAFTHTKTGQELQVLKLETKLSKEQFKAFNDWLKANSKGYYSRFARGFILTTDSNLEVAS
jgi:hypothetical protein